MGGLGQGGNLPTDEVSQKRKVKKVNKMLQFTLSRKQFKELSALAYWVADEQYIRERHGADDPELQRCRETITKSIFPNLDSLQVPFWVQNVVICWAENWRSYKSEYLDHFLKNKNITIGL